MSFVTSRGMLRGQYRRSRTTKQPYGRRFRSMVGGRRSPCATLARRRWKQDGRRYRTVNAVHASRSSETDLLITNQLSCNSLPQRPQKWLPQKRIALRLHRLRPFGVVDVRALRFVPRFAVPADLFHVVVELEGEAVGVDGEGAVVDSRE